MSQWPELHWEEAGSVQHARWRSEVGLPPPRRVMLADDTLAADAAWRAACEGTGLLWRGDFQNARHLIDAMQRRIERPPRHGSRKARTRDSIAPPAAASASTDGNPTPGSRAMTERFHQQRLTRAQRARTLGMLLMPIEPDYSIALRRAPDLRLAFREAWGEPDGLRSVVSLRELQGLVGAHEWRRNGVVVPALGEDAQGNRIHPWYGVFAPVRGEYVDLVAQAALPVPCRCAFDIGTGTGVLAAVLARRGISRIVASDLDPRALACAAENLQQLGVAGQVGLLEVDLFPPGEADLVVCNPPWLPGRASSALERAVYDEDSRMLRGFLAGLAGHLSPQGEGWLLLSDLAEHLGLRTRAQLMDWITAADLMVAGRHQIRPRHGKRLDASDPLHPARAIEMTSLWRLRRLAAARSSAMDNPSC